MKKSSVLIPCYQASEHINFVWNLFKNHGLPELIYSILVETYEIIKNVNEVRFAVRAAIKSRLNSAGR